MVRMRVLFLGLGKLERVPAAVESLPFLPGPVPADILSGFFAFDPLVALDFGPHGTPEADKGGVSHPGRHFRMNAGGSSFGSGSYHVLLSLG